MSDDNGQIVPFPGKPGEPATPENRKPKRKVRRRTKGERLEAGRQALEMMLASFPLDVIAERTGYESPSGAYKAAMAALRETTAPIAEEARDVELRKVDRILNALWARAIGLGLPGPDLEALDRVHKFLLMRHRLLGVDAQKMEFSGPEGGPLDVQVTADVREFIALLAQVAPDAGAIASLVDAPPNGSALPVRTNGEAGPVPPQLPA